MEEGTTITRLTAEDAVRVHAGVVIGSPSVVVKELLENALDSRATLITLRVSPDLSRISVEDNGTGVAPPYEGFGQAGWTSRTDTATPSPGYYGYRGYALASIARHAKSVVVRTKPAQHPGVEIDLTEGTPPSPLPSLRRRGTVVTVADPFSQVPVRDRFWREPSRMRKQWAEIQHLCVGLGIVHPRLKLVVCKGDTTTSADTAKPVATAEESVAAAFGNKAYSALDRVEASEGGITAVVHLPKIGEAGFAATRSSDDRAYCIVNMRPVKWRPAIARVRAAHLLLRHPRAGSQQREPVMAITLSVPHECVDVTLCPQKTEVFLSNEEDVLRVIDVALSRQPGLPADNGWCPKGQAGLAASPGSGDDPRAGDDVLFFTSEAGGLSGIATQAYEYAPDEQQQQQQGGGDGTPTPHATSQAAGAPAGGAAGAARSPRPDPAEEEEEGAAVSVVAAVATPKSSERREKASSSSRGSARQKRGRSEDGGGAAAAAAAPPSEKARRVESVRKQRAPQLQQTSLPFLKSAQPPTPAPCLPERVVVPAACLSDDEDEDDVEDTDTPTPPPPPPTHTTRRAPPAAEANGDAGMGDDDEEEESLFDFEIQPLPTPPATPPPASPPPPPPPTHPASDTQPPRGGGVGPQATAGESDITTTTTTTTTPSQPAAPAPSGHSAGEGGRGCLGSPSAPSAPSSGGVGSTSGSARRAARSGGSEALLSAPAEATSQLSLSQARGRSLGVVADFLGQRGAVRLPQLDVTQRVAQTLGPSGPLFRDDPAADFQLLGPQRLRVTPVLLQGPATPPPLECLIGGTLSIVTLVDLPAQSAQARRTIALASCAAPPDAATPDVCFAFEPREVHQRAVFAEMASSHSISRTPLSGGPIRLAEWSAPAAAEEAGSEGGEGGGSAAVQFTPEMLRRLRLECTERPYLAADNGFLLGIGPEGEDDLLVTDLHDGSGVSGYSIRDVYEVASRLCGAVDGSLAAARSPRAMAQFADIARLQTAAAFAQSRLTSAKALAALQRAVEVRGIPQHLDPLGCLRTVCMVA